MPQYVIERDLPGAGQLTADELHSTSAKSNEVLASMSPRAEWQHSYVTADKIYCVYIADDEETVREHARLGGFPANSVAQVNNVINPATGA